MQQITSIAPVALRDCRPISQAHTYPRTRQTASRIADQTSTLDHMTIPALLARFPTTHLSATMSARQLFVAGARRAIHTTPRRLAEVAPPAVNVQGVVSEVPVQKPVGGFR